MNSLSQGVFDCTKIALPFGMTTFVENYMNSFGCLTHSADLLYFCRELYE